MVLSAFTFHRGRWSTLGAFGRAKRDWRTGDRHARRTWRSSPQLIKHRWLSTTAGWCLTTQLWRTLASATLSRTSPWYLAYFAANTLRSDLEEYIAAFRLVCTCYSTVTFCLCRSPEYYELHFDDRSSFICTHSKLMKPSNEKRMHRTVAQSNFCLGLFAIAKTVVSHLHPCLDSFRAV